MKQVGNTILAKGGNHILAKRDNSAWPKGSKLSGFSKRIDRTAGHEVDKRGVFVAIPYILHLAVNRRIDIEELLELIDDQVIPFRLSGTHQHLEDICKGIDGFRNEDIR